MVSVYIEILGHEMNTASICVEIKDEGLLSILIQIEIIFIQIANLIIFMLDTQAI
jgi:hypothetical protein